MTKHEYIHSKAFKEAVKRIWTRLLIAGGTIAVVIGWYFHDILATVRTPVIQATLGEFMGISMIVYVSANILLHWLTDGNHRK